MRLIHATAFLFLGLGLGMAAPGNNPSAAGSTEVRAQALDTARIHALYIDGDFEQAIDKIQSSLKGGGPFSHSDSVFIYKHLGIMYAARYDTREKGKQCMMLLLQTEPTAKIMDMYASDMIYMIFKNIQDEFEMSRAKLQRARNHVEGHAQAPAPDTSEARGKSGSSAARKPATLAWVGWTAGGLAVVAGAFLLYHFAGEKPAPRVDNQI